MKKVWSVLRWERIISSGLVVGLGVAIAIYQSVDSPTSVEARPDPAVSTGQGGASETGMASYYGFKYQGRPTASGEIFDINRLTAAHPTLKFGTKVRVTNLSNERSVEVRINDRGPFIKGRIIDLSLAAAEELQMVHSGVIEVKVEVLK